MNIDDKKHEELQIKNIEKDNNAKKPLAILIMISSFFFGAFLGVAMCFLSDFIGDFEGLSFGEAWLCIQKYLTIPTRALYVVGDLVLLGVVLFFYRKAMKTWKTNTDEDEKYEKTDKYISLFMILVSFANCFNLSVFGVALYNKPGVITLLNELYGDTISKIVNFADLLIAVFLTILLSLVFLYLQKKIIDLLRIMNPEKKGSAYDPKFHKVWYESCDEAERMQIGNASYKAYRTTNALCIIMMTVFICIGVVFEIGILPIVIPAVICAVMNLVYGFEAMKR